MSLSKILGGFAIAALAIQFIPYGHSHFNPPRVREPGWDKPETRELARRACFNCHSNETVWPWYSNVAPVSWLTERDVNDGRRHLNFSEFNRPYKHAGRASKEVREGDMPPWYYLPTPMHPEARLTSAEHEALIDGLAKTLGTADQ